MKTCCVATLLALSAGIAFAAPDSSPETALADYVAAPDASYGWQVRARYEVPGAAVVELGLRSQTWRDIVWKHQLYLIKPDTAADARQGLLVIAGGRWRDRYENAAGAELPDDAELFIQIATRLQTVVAVLRQVPFQPLFHRNEDELIAYTFDEYLASGDAEWPLLLPMVKSTVRAMDATQELAAAEWNVALERFIVLGGSKRGWTTWLTGAVEPRAAALVPVVIDALNFEAHMPYQTTVWGAPSDKLAPYTQRNLIDVLGSAGGRALRAIVDPYSYRERFTQPKLVVVATNDAYFPPDSLNLYWDALPEPKHVLYLPNQTHDVEDFTRLISALDALHREDRDGVVLPELDWEFQNRDGALRLCVRADPAPAAVAAWTAESADTDFRDAQFVAQPVTGLDGVFVFDLDLPAAGFRAVFAESTFGNGAERFPLSTNLRITDAAGRSLSDATAIRGKRGVCP